MALSHKMSSRARRPKFLQVHEFMRAPNPSFKRTAFGSRLSQTLGCCSWLRQRAAFQASSGLRRSHRAAAQWRLQLLLGFGHFSASSLFGALPSTYSPSGMNLKSGFGIVRAKLCAMLSAQPSNASRWQQPNPALKRTCLRHAA